MNTVSIIGLGETGERAARQLLAQRPDLDLTVFDRDGGRCEAFRGLATLAGNAGEALRESQTIVLALTEPHDVDRVLQRYSDGEVNADLSGKCLLNLCPLAGAWAEDLARSVEACGAAYRWGEPALDELMTGAVAAPSP